MTDEIPIHNNRCEDCNQRKVVTKTGPNTCQIQCGCVSVEVNSTFELPGW